MGKEPWQVREREGGEVTAAEVRGIEVARGVYGIPSNRTEIALMRTEFNPDKVRRTVQFPPSTIQDTLTLWTIQHVAAFSILEVSTPVEN